MMYFLTFEWLADFLFPASSFEADTLELNQFLQKMLFFTNATLDFIIAVLIWVSGVLMILCVLLDLVSSQNSDFRNHLGDPNLSIGDAFFIPFNGQQNFQIFYSPIHPFKADALKMNQIFQEIFFFTNVTLDFLMELLIWVSGALVIPRVFTSTNKIFSLLPMATYLKNSHNKITEACIQNSRQI